MKKRLVLTSLVAVWCVCPVFAARAEDGGEAFPTNGLMLEDKTYDNAATYDNMGVYDGGVTATAEYENTLYQIAAGTYLPAGAEVAEQCPANSYCPGMTNATYDESAAQGVWSCPDGYPNSAAGASTNTQCYTACTVDMVDKAMAVSGNDYFGAGVDTCGATACEGGYHMEGSSINVFEQTPLIDVDYTVESSGHEYIRVGGITAGAGAIGLTEAGTWATEYDYGVVYGRASCQATPHDPGLQYIDSNIYGFSQGVLSPDRVRSYLTPLVGAAKANYLADIAAIDDAAARQYAFAEAQYVVFGSTKDASYSTTDTGDWCYCQMTGFKASGSSSVVNIASAPWVGVGTILSNLATKEEACAQLCVLRCAQQLWPLQRGAMFGAFGTVAYGTCAANEITINWDDATADDIAANNAGMCTYDGDVRTPVRAVKKPGKRFVGWEFIK